MASFLFSAPQGAVGVGNTFDVAVMVDPGGSSLNALQGILTFDPAVVRYVSGNTARSALTLWVDDPASADGSSGQVSFAGITPGGFGNTLLAPDDYAEPVVFVARFEVIAPGAVTFSVTDPQTFANDGAGTPVATSVVPLDLPLLADRQISSSDSDTLVAADHTPPAAFTPLILQASDAFAGQRVVVFSTTDKESGIAYYKVQENGGEPMRAASPYVLAHQQGYVALTVTAVDRAGNAQVAYAHAGIPWMLLAGCGSIALFFIFFFVVMVRRVKLRSRR